MSDIEEHAELRGHVLRIVLACLERPARLWAVRGALPVMAPDENGTHQVCRLVESASMAGPLPGKDLWAGRELLRRSAGLPAVVDRAFRGRGYRPAGRGSEHRPGQRIRPAGRLGRRHGA
ncbi:effector-associated domain 2-containing protein [Actinoplanes subtropicus]|uniref:effector-associated domain 2-containing protein n=1 Tax=Actinoplanes subtropicus TaxID=543632 RepID=UPI003CCC3B87